MEDQMQSDLFQFYAIAESRIPELRWAFHTPNGGHRHLGVAMKLKRMGVRRGVPDVLIPVSNGVFTGLAIELKHKRNRQTAEQTSWLAHLRSQNWQVEVCYGWERAAIITLHYFSVAPCDFGLSGL